MSQDVERWLTDLGLQKHCSVFVENEIDFATLRLLSEEDLREMGLPLGPRRRIQAAIAELEAIPKTDNHISHGEAERRQLTIMFVDLVGSTELSSRIDPEDMRKLIGAYQDTVGTVAARYEGHVAKYMGDGVVLYFGFPRAKEDDAERAAHAGLEIVSAVSALRPESGSSLACRIGIATGAVVVGDLIGQGAAQEEAVTGATPNLAARLEAIARPGQVVIAESTRRLLGDLFDLQALGEQSLKGFEDPTRAWLLRSARRVESRFDAVRGSSMLKFVGRQQELGLLHERWERAKNGEGQSVVLSGEAGIGKSRLVQAFYRSIVDDDHTRLRYQCSPTHANSVLHPFITQIANAAGIDDTDKPDAKLDKLEQVLRQATEDFGDTAPLLAQLLSIPYSHRYGGLDLAGPQLMQRTQLALIEQLIALATHQTVLVIFEDIHWADPTTIELLTQMVGRIQDACVLVVITHRPDFSLPHSIGPSTTTLSLNRLSRRQSIEIIAELSRNRPLPSALVDQIIRRTDGVPLFLEELTKTVLEAKTAADEAGLVEPAGPVWASTIPSTLQDSLIARLDNLGAAKEIAQIGAAVGREFPHRIVCSLAPLTADNLEQAFASLVDSELVFQRGLPPDAIYSFKHALVRDAAYESLLKNRRTELHAQIHAWLEQDQPHLIETEPELLAYHATQARDAVSASDLWLRAGRRAASNSANTEAVNHLRNGLFILQSLPEGEERDRIELSYLISLGPALMATAGWDAEEVDQTYSRARELARVTNQSAVLFPAIWGLWLVAHAGGDVVNAKSLFAELTEISRDEPDSEIELQTHHAGASEMFTEGKFAKTQQHVDASLALYNSKTHADQALRYGGHDPGVCVQSIGALNLLMTGDPITAEQYSKRALAWAVDVKHQPSVAHADLYRAELCHLLGRPGEVEGHARRALRIAEQYGIAHYAAWSRMLIGWSRCAQGEIAEGRALVDRGLAELRKVGIRYHLPHRLALRVEALMAANQVEESILSAEECLKSVVETGERWFEPEALRLVAATKIEKRGSDLVEVQSLALRSLRVSEELQSPFWSLRSATFSVDRLGQLGDSAEHRQQLATICQSFVEGADLPELRRARERLTRLQND